MSKDEQRTARRVAGRMTERNTANGWLYEKLADTGEEKPLFFDDDVEEREIMDSRFERGDGALLKFF